MAEVLSVTLSDFLVNIRELVARNNKDDSVKAIVANYFESNFNGFHEHSVDVHLDCPLLEEDEPIFQALFSCIPVQGIVLTGSVEAKLVPHMLTLALTALAPDRPDYSPTITFEGIRMSGMEAEAIFEAIRGSNVGYSMTLDLDDTPVVDEIVIHALAMHIASSDIYCFFLMRYKDTPDAMLTKKMFDTIFDAIASSESMQMLYLGPFLVAPSDMDGATETIAKTLLRSSSLENVQFFDGNNAAAFSSTNIYDSLMRSAQVKTFDLLVNHVEDGDDRELVLCRNNPWKRFLPEDIPLDLWPFVLVETNEWKKYQSHTSLDAMYFLIKEKPDVLLQNIHRRKQCVCPFSVLFSIPVMCFLLFLLFQALQPLLDGPVVISVLSEENCTD